MPHPVSAPRVRRAPARGRPWRSFTLIELVVVIVVLALLIAAAAFGYTRFIDGTRTTAARALAVQVGKAIKAHSAHTGTPYGAAYDEPVVNDLVAEDLPTGGRVTGMTEQEDGEHAGWSSLDVSSQNKTATLWFQTGTVAGPYTLDAATTAAPPVTDPPAPTVAYADEVLADTPSHYYRLQETSGTTAADSSGNSAHATYGAANLNLPGPLRHDPDARAVGLSGGTSTYINRSISDPALTDGLGAIEFWAKFVATSTTETRYLPMRYASAAMHPGFVINTAGRVVFSNSGTGSLSTPTSMLDGQWHHYVGTMNATNIELIVDGVVVDSIPWTPSSRVATSRIGIVSQSGVPAATGAFAEIAFYRHPLPADRARAHYQAAGYTP